MRTPRHRSAASRAGRSAPLLSRPATHLAHSRGLSAGKLCTSSLSRLRAVTARVSTAAVVALGLFSDINARLATVAGFWAQHTSFRPCASWLSAGGKPRIPATLLGPTTVVSLALMLMVTPAQAQRCGPSDGLAQQLRARFGEEVIRTEVKPDGSAVMQLWVNPDSRTWTMVLSTITPRMSCIIGAGRDYDGPLPEQDEKL